MYWSQRGIEISFHRTDADQYMQFIIIFEWSVHSQDFRIAEPVPSKIWSFTFLCHSSAKSSNRSYSSAFIPHCINVWIYRKIMILRILSIRYLIFFCHNWKVLNFRFCLSVKLYLLSPLSVMVDHHKVLAA